MEDLLKKVIGALENERINITRHAWQEMRNDDLLLDDVITATINGTLIENYPEDFPLPSGLVSGEKKSGEPIHSVWALNEKAETAILVTVYRPDRKRWINFKKRRD